MASSGVIILGCEYQALGILRQLKRTGIDCVLMDQEKHGPARYSRYRGRFFRTPDYSSDEFWPWLKTTAMSIGLEGWVVIPTDDEQVRQLAENFVEATTLFKYAGIPWENYKKIYDKRECYQWMGDLGVQRPISVLPNSREDALQAELTFPFIVKPAVKRTFKKWCNKKAIVVKSKEELKEVVFGKLRNVPLNELLLQEIIPGGGEYQWSYAGFFVEGIPVAAFTAKRRRQHPPDFGRASTYVESIHDPEVEEKSKRILREMTYSGFAEVEWKKDPRDTSLKFLEVNARSWGWHSIAERIVGNLPLMYYKYLTQGELQTEKPNYGTRWIKWITDMPVAAHMMINKELTLGDWYRSVKGNVVSCDWDRDDPLPFFMQFLLIPYLIRKRGY